MSALEAAWYRKAAWLWLLRPLEWLFRLVAAGRRSAYRRGLLPSYRPERPLVVVGNITVGGTGKTPVVIALVEAIKACGLRPGVVSRGYGASAPSDSFPHWVGPQSRAADCGDEPLLIQRRTGVPVVVAPRRADAARTLLERGDVDILISDDGLQHYALARDLEIAVIDRERGLGNGWCLPAGPLREPPARLQSVDWVLQRGGDTAAAAVRYAADVWVNIHTAEERPLAAFAGERDVVAIAGIGQPAQFFATVEQHVSPRECRAFPDHHHYSTADFAALGGGTILMTEKDAVKCAQIAGADAWYLRINAVLPEPLLACVTALARR